MTGDLIPENPSTYPKSTCFTFMKINLLAFGIAKDIFGGRAIEMDFPETSLSAAFLSERLKKNYPKLSELKSFMLAVNSEYAEPDLLISEGDEVAIIPPVSGG